jgi:hypothetical protein
MTTREQASKPLRWQDRDTAATLSIRVEIANYFAYWVSGARARSRAVGGKYVVLHQPNPTASRPTVGFYVEHQTFPYGGYWQRQYVGHADSLEAASASPTMTMSDVAKRERWPNANWVPISPFVRFWLIGVGADSKRKIQQQRDVGGEGGIRTLDTALDRITV